MDTAHLSMRPKLLVSDGKIKTKKLLGDLLYCLYQYLTLVIAVGTSGLRGLEKVGKA